MSGKAPIFISFCIGILSAILVVSAIGFIVAHKNNRVSARATINAPQAQPTFAANHKSWTVTIKQPINAILHWRENISISPHASPSDPGPGHIITEDQWVITNAQGITIFYHMVATLPNGDLYQNIFSNGTESVRINGPGYKAMFGNAQNALWCVEKGGPDPSLSQYVFPLYINQAELKQDGFQAVTTTQASEPLPPDSNATVQGTVSQTYAVPPSIIKWQGIGQGAVKGNSEIVFFEADSTNRIIDADIQSFDNTGRMINDQWYSIGRVDIYPATVQVPTWVTTNPATTTKGC